MKIRLLIPQIATLCIICAMANSAIASDSTEEVTELDKIGEKLDTITKTLELFNENIKLINNPQNLTDKASQVTLFWADHEKFMSFIADYKKAPIPEQESALKNSAQNIRLEGTFLVRVFDYYGNNTEFVDHLINAAPLIGLQIKTNENLELEHTKNSIFKETLSILPENEKITFINDAKKHIAQELLIQELRKIYQDANIKDKNPFYEELYEALKKWYITKKLDKKAQEELNSLFINLKKTPTLFLSNTELEKQFKKELSHDTLTQLYSAGHHNLLSAREKIGYHAPLLIQLPASVALAYLTYKNKDVVFPIPLITTADTWMYLTKFFTSKNSFLLQLPAYTVQAALLARAFKNYHQYTKQTGGLQPLFSRQVNQFKTHPLASMISMFPTITSIIVSFSNIEFSKNPSSVKGRHEGYFRWGGFGSYWYHKNILPAGIVLLGLAGSKCAQKYGNSFFNKLLNTV